MGNVPPKPPLSSFYLTPKQRKEIKMQKKVRLNGQHRVMSSPFKQACFDSSKEGIWSNEPTELVHGAEYLRTAGCALLTLGLLCLIGLCLVLVIGCVAHMGSVLPVSPPVPERRTLLREQEDSREQTPKKPSKPSSAQTTSSNLQNEKIRVQTRD